MNIALVTGGQQEEIARIIAWLLSNDVSYVTGTIVDDAGGR